MYWRYGIGVEQAAEAADDEAVDDPDDGVDRTRLSGPAGANYEAVVRMHLSWIDEAKVGRLLFRAIAREVVLGNQENLAEFQKPVAAGYPTHGVLVQPYTGGRCNAQAESAVVSFSPYSFFGPCYKYVKSVTKNRALYPWQVLFHELVHAYRQASGNWDPEDLDGDLELYDNREEFISIVVTNIYISDLTNQRADHVGLRRDHHRHHKMPANLSDDLGFFESSHDTFDQIEQFCVENEWFTKQLAEIVAEFNPIHAYYYDRKEARKRSLSSL